MFVLYFLINILLSRIVNRPLILCFHRIGKHTGSILDLRVGKTDVRSFTIVICCLRILGYRFVTLEYLKDCIDSTKLGRFAVITFDDGYKDLYQNAFPILKKYKIPFTLFLTTSTVGSEKLLWLHKIYISIDRLSHANRLKILNHYFTSSKSGDNLLDQVDKLIVTKNIGFIEKIKIAEKIAYESGLSDYSEIEIAKELYLTKAELKKMELNGLSIEVHGHGHLVPDNLNRLETEDEIKTSYSYIIKEFERQPQFYCLPYGLSNKFIGDVVRKYHIKGITTVEGRLVKEFDDAYSLPRFCITDDNLYFFKRLAKCYVKSIYRKYISKNIILNN